jgi:hypothetical protein
MNPYAGRRVLVTGGLGFLGSNLSIELVQRGADVMIVDSMARGCGRNYRNIDPVARKVDVLESDIGDSDRVGQVLKTVGILVPRASALDVLRGRHSQFTVERQRFTRGRLIELVTPQGIRVLRGTYANSLLLSVALARFRIVDLLLRMWLASVAQPVARWLNRVLFSELKLEVSWMGSGRDIPLGHSLTLVGERAA